MGSSEEKTTHGAQSRPGRSPCMQPGPWVRRGPWAKLPQGPCLNRPLGQGPSSLPGRPLTPSTLWHCLRQVLVSLVAVSHPCSLPHLMAPLLQKTTADAQAESDGSSAPHPPPQAP